MFQIMTFSLLLFTFFPRFRAFFSFKFSKCGRHLSALSTRMHRHTHSDTGFILFKSHAAHNTFAAITFLSRVFFCVHIRAVWLVGWFSQLAKCTLEACAQKEEALELFQGETKNDSYYILRFILKRHSSICVLCAHFPRRSQAHRSQE